MSSNKTQIDTLDEFIGNYDSSRTIQGQATFPADFRRICLTHLGKEESESFEVYLLPKNHRYIVTEIKDMEKVPNRKKRFYKRLHVCSKGRCVIRFKDEKPKENLCDIIF